MATQMIDLKMDEDEDIDIQANDFANAESTAMHQQQLILNNKGDFKENPTICACAFNYLDDENKGELIRAISIEFAKDGMEVKSIKTSSTGTIVSDAYYK